MCVRQGSGEEGGGSDEGHKDREGRGKPEGDEDDDLEFGGLMDGQQLMDGQEDEDDEMFDAQHSGTGTIGGAAMCILWVGPGLVPFCDQCGVCGCADEAFMRSGNLHLPFDHAYRASLAGTLFYTLPPSNTPCPPLPHPSPRDTDPLSLSCVCLGIIGAYGGAQSQSTWSNGRHNANVGPQYHTQPPAFDDQGYFYGAAGATSPQRTSVR